MKISVKYLAILLAIIFVACGPSDEDKAKVKLDFAKKLLLKNLPKFALHLLHMSMKRQKQ